MIGKVLKFVVPVALGAAVALQWQDVRRYAQIKFISSGHPEAVPAGGATSYSDAAHAEADGTGDFDSAARGGGPVQGTPTTLPGEARRNLAA
jgi:hypothetical protein